MRAAEKGADKSTGAWDLSILCLSVAGPVAVPFRSLHRKSDMVATFILVYLILQQNIHYIIVVLTRIDREIKCLFVSSDLQNNYIQKYE